MIVYVDNRVEIKVAVRDYAELKKSDSVFYALKEFKKVLPKVADQLSADKPDLMHYSVGLYGKEL